MGVELDKSFESAFAPFRPSVLLESVLRVAGSAKGFLSSLFIRLLILLSPFEVSRICPTLPALLPCVTTPISANLLSPKNLPTSCISNLLFLKKYSGLSLIFCINFATAFVLLKSSGCVFCNCVKSALIESKSTPKLFFIVWLIGISL